jgi:hypothetical protein
MDYTNYVIASESPNGEDNRMGSGAFSRFQFMPATAVELARRTAWGSGATPENVKSLVMAQPGRDKELFGLYNANSQGALKSAGLPATNPNMMAMHRFGQGGGTSLLKAPGTMSVQDWVRSINWGPGIAASEVIRQNRLDRFKNVDALRHGFLGGNFASAFEGAEPPTPESTPLFADPAPSGPRSGRDPDQAANMLLAQSMLADVFTQPVTDRKKQKKTQRLFG